MDKSGLLPPQGNQVGVANPGEPPRRVHHAFVAVLDGDRDESLFLERADVGANLPVTDAEEFGEMLVGGKTAALVVEGLDFHQQHFFHQRKLLGTPYSLRNPDPFEIAWEFLHRLILA